jgi:hypothetical protein
LNSNEALAQREQLNKYLEWVKTEGGIEGPTHLSTMFKPHQKVRCEWLRENCIGKILELGTCYGFVLAYCGGHIGLDINPASIQLARILNPEMEFIVGDIRHVPLADKSVDTTIIPDCLEHVPWEDVSLVINEAIRVSRMRVLITVPWEEDGLEAGSFKHQWLCTPPKLTALSKMLPGDYHIVTAGGFAYIRVVIN